jgi:hypothetical protein
VAYLSIEKYFSYTASFLLFGAVMSAGQILSGKARQLPYRQSTTVRLFESLPALRDLLSQVRQPNISAVTRNQILFRY